MNKTGNIFNDFECYKYKNIFNNINIAICNTKHEREFNKKEGYANNCELVIKLKGELDARIYTYDNINSLLQASYFIWQLDNHRSDIEVFQIFINDEISYIFDYWKAENERKMQERINLLEKENKMYKEFIKKYNAEKTFEEYKQKL